MNQAVHAINANGIGMKTLHSKNEELKSNVTQLDTRMNELKESHDSHVELLNKKIDDLEVKLSEIDQLLHQIVNS